ncbi:hypothetical protein PQR68_31555 [Paraburkholderia agricolaris]|uniref:hypothetical protein n=1 Tax=Paraburkholderia agricolaris TaxID=2152888 RepID=UPI00129095D0|nr:hypothetical protein [Paraburkholderia agricolaris]
MKPVRGPHGADTARRNDRGDDRPRQPALIAITRTGASASDEDRFRRALRAEDESNDDAFSPAVKRQPPIYGSVDAQAESGTPQRVAHQQQTERQADVTPRSMPTPASTSESARTATRFTHEDVRVVCACATRLWAGLADDRRAVHAELNEPELGGIVVTVVDEPAALHARIACTTHETFERLAGARYTIASTLAQRIGRSVSVVIALSGNLERSVEAVAQPTHE